MAIKFLDAIDLTGLEVQNVLAQNIQGNPTTALGEGQFFFDSSTNVKTLKYWNGTAWIELDGQGGVASITADPGLTGNSSTGAVTIGPDYGTSKNIILSATNLVGTRIADDAHIIYSDAKSIVNYGAVQDLPFTANTGTVTGVSGTAPIVSSGGTSPAISIDNFTGANGTSAGKKGAVPAPAAADNVKYLKGDGTWATVPASFTGFNITDGKNPFSVASGNTVTLSSSTLTLDTSTALTVGIDMPTVNANVGSFSSANITVDAQGRVTAASAGGSGTMTSFSVTGDTGTKQTIGNGDTLDIVGNTGIDTETGAANTDQITISLDLCELDPPKGDIDPTKDSLVGCFNSINGKVVIGDIPLSDFANPTGNLDMNSKNIVAMADPVNAQDASTKNYVDTTFAGSGSLIFQGGYDASTAAPTGASVKKGFTYAVTTAGTGNPVNFWNPKLEVGDLIIANQDNPTSASDWTEINKNIDVATAVVQGIANFPTAGGLSVNAGAVSLANSGVKGASYGKANTVAEITVDDKGIVTAAADTTIDIAASQVQNFCDEVVKCTSGTDRQQTGTIGGSTSMAISHSLKTRNVMVQIYSNASPFDTVECKVERTDVNTVTVKVAKAPAANSLVYMLQKIG